MESFLIFVEIQYRINSLKRF